MQHTTDERFYNGRFVEVNERLVRAGLDRIAGLLNLKKGYSFKLLAIPLQKALDGMSDGVSIGNSNFFTGQIALTNPSHQATITHECTHFVLGKNGLYLVDPRERDFYGRLISETFAELTCATEYGFREEGDPLHIIAPRDTRSAIARDLAREHRELENQKNRMSNQRIDNFLERVYERKDDDVVLDYVIQLLAISNAYHLAKNRVSPSKLVHALKGNKNAFPIEFYINQIIRRVQT